MKAFLCLAILAITVSSIYAKDMECAKWTCEKKDEEPCAV